MQGMGSTITPLLAIVPVISIWIVTDHFPRHLGGVQRSCGTKAEYIVLLYWHATTSSRVLLLRHGIPLFMT